MGKARSKRIRLMTAATAALAALITAALPGVARASSPASDPVTGSGPTASTITVPWTQGLLDNTNTPIPSANADRSSSTPSSPVSFMYNDFRNLKVTVSQTQNLGHQAVSVSWTGGKPTVKTGTFQADFLQLMECWGDATSGPTPEQCEYGSRGLLAPGSLNPGIGERTGLLCTAGSAPSTTNPPAALDGSNPVAGCDPQEPSDPTHLAPCPDGGCGTPADFTIPFSPVSNPTALDYAGGATYFDAGDSNEIPGAVTRPDGTGQQPFQTLTGTQAPGLGCGQLDSDGRPRGCWLVIVPRGEFEPNGYPINVNSGVSFLRSSPLSAGNWAQRIQIHLGYSQVQAACPLGGLERETIGTQLAGPAAQSWDLKLNQATNCAKLYSFTATPEATSTQQLSSPASGVGLAFTTIPIGSEATRTGGSPPSGLPPVIYAPVAVSALDFGFNINYGDSGYVTTPVKLTPLLLAKALTQSYRQDLPDYFPDKLLNGPSWSQGNPLNISTDPQFQALNPTIPADVTGPIAPLLTGDHSALNQQVWQWVQGDSAARGWLGGTPDATDGNMAVDPDYQALHLGQPPAADSYPRAYTGRLDLGLSEGNPPEEEIKLTQDLLPYTDNYSGAVAAVASATDPDYAGGWNSTARAPDGTTGWWDQAGREPAGQTFMWAPADTPNLAAFGLTPAQLCNAAGTVCVSPSTASVTAALRAARPDRSGLLHVDPARPGNGGYPLVAVTYAAVPLNQNAAALRDYAALIAYAAGPGQTPGTAAGNLPPGYLPLPAALRLQALAVAARLLILARHH